MSRLGCKCGHIMGSSACPSPYSIYVYYASEVNQAISENNKITLMDFLGDWDEKNNCPKQYMKRKEVVDYWYCTECKRVYECQIKIGGHWLRVYEKKKVGSDEGVDKNKCSRLYIFSEKCSDNATEDNPKILLSDFINSLETEYYANSDETKIYALSKDSRKLLYIYEIEEIFLNDNI